MHEIRYTEGKSGKAASMRAAHVDVRVMRGPVSATRSFGPLSVVIGGVHDETFFRLDMPVDRAARVVDALPAIVTVALA